MTRELEDFDPVTGHRHDCRPAVPHVPLVVCIPNEGQALELLDEKDMENHGWVRVGATVKRQGSTVHLSPGAYS